MLIHDISEFLLQQILQLHIKRRIPQIMDEQTSLVCDGIKYFLRLRNRRDNIFVVLLVATMKFRQENITSSSLFSGSFFLILKLIYMKIPS